MNKIIHLNTNIYGATTLKDIKAPEQNNMALHVCLNSEDVMKNRKELEKETLPLENWVLPWQKHTANVQRVSICDHGKGAYTKEDSILNVDALYTTEPNTLIGVFTADCVGVLVVDETTPCVCVIHSGWKGTAQGIVDKVVKELISKDLLHPQFTKAYFSPSILFDSLEVGMEVIDLIHNLDFDVEPFIRYMPHQKAYLDNQGLCIQMLKNNGITQIVPSTMDTKKEIETCFSYRNNKQTGEHFTFGFIKE
ncbi:polyphenol oxidase family protein [Floccifex sp.]|uniref:polyphenol oxidase family protein n=1 Tax=Floccifex sp. TaxID=2815810 RepID=UPI002A74F012|nr:laccase domain-containing protein [Floccifex sp.]MDD7282182.1 laccase domain-containing protein [Erysipelotrichaceae bacterium]MDY2959075.1 laccase domain-containing protein [Floccifex sp.]